MHSSMAKYVNLSPNHSGPRNHKVDTLTPHYMAGNLTIETCAQIFKPVSRQASSNYGIGSDGRVGVYVEEENRAWTSGSGANDHRAITFECANLPDGSLTNACWNSLVALCADICERYDYSGVYYCGAADYSRLPKGKMLLTMHKWFQDTDCPGPWLSLQFERLAREINAKIAGKEDKKEEGHEEDDMICIISIKNRNTLVWFDGVNVNDLTHPNDVNVLSKLYKACNGRDIPRVTLTEEEFARLCQASKGSYPKHLKDLVDKYPSRSPEE